MAPAATQGIILFLEFFSDLIACSIATHSGLRRSTERRGALPFKVIVVPNASGSFYSRKSGRRGSTRGTGSPGGGRGETNWGRALSVSGCIGDERVGACVQLTLGEFFQQLHPVADICLGNPYPFPVRHRGTVLTTGRVPLSSELERLGAACQWHNPQAGAREGHLRGAWSLDSGSFSLALHRSLGEVLSWEETTAVCLATSPEGWRCPGDTFKEAAARVPASGAGSLSPATAVSAGRIAARLGLGGELDRLFLVLLVAPTAAAPRC